MHTVCFALLVLRFKMQIEAHKADKESPNEPLNISSDCVSLVIKSDLKACLSALNLHNEARQKCHGY